jgi:hypothetical protein
MAHYTPPELDSHKVAYHGRRFWIIEVDAEHPFNWVSAMVGEYAAHDAAEVLTIGCASKHPDGGYSCEFHRGPDVLERHVSLRTV